MLHATYQRGAIMRYAWKTYKLGFFASIGDAIKYAWAIARQQVRTALRDLCSAFVEYMQDARDNATKTAKRVLGIVREFVISSAQVGEVTATRKKFAISCNASDIQACKGQKRYKRDSYLRPAMNAQVLTNQIKEYRP